MGRKERIDSAHNDREDQDANELNDHRVDVLLLRLAIDVTVADCGQRGDDPVETCDVDVAAVIFLGADGKVWVVEPRAPSLRLSDQDPPAGNHMHDREEDD